jgi:hypothetical protein
MKTPIIYALLLATGLFIGNLWSSKAQENFGVKEVSGEAKALQGSNANGRYQISRPTIESSLPYPTILLDTQTGQVFKLCTLDNEDKNSKAIYWAFQEIDVFLKPKK